MIKVKFFSNYDSSFALVKRFRDNYIIPDDKLTFTTADDYDVAVVFNKTNEDINNNATVIVVVQEPSWSPVWGDNYFDYADYVLVHDKTLFPRLTESNKVIEGPSFMWYHDHVNYNFFTNINKSKKRRKLSMIVSNLNMNIPNTNYVKRIGLVEKILKSDLDIDIYGKGLSINDARFKGEVSNKFEALIPYEFSIAIENSCEKNYISEKFFDCTLCNTKPIYYGAPNIGDVYRWFEPLDLDGADVIGQIKQIISQPASTEDNNSNYDTMTYYLDHNLYHQLTKILC